MTDQVEEELRSKIKQRLIELENLASDEISAFRAQLNQLITEVQKEKIEYIEQLRRFDSKVIRDAVAKAVEEFIENRSIFPFPFPKRQ